MDSHQFNHRKWKIGERLYLVCPNFSIKNGHLTRSGWHWEEGEVTAIELRKTKKGECLKIKTDLSSSYFRVEQCDHLFKSRKDATNKVNELTKNSFTF